MAFDIRSYAQVLDGMIQHVRGTTDKVTDFNVGSVARTLLEAPALEIDEAYQTLYYSLLEAIPTALYQGFGFGILPATPAGGLVEFTLTSPASGADLEIRAGTPLIGQNGVLYATVADAVIAAGTTSVTIQVVAQEPGSAGNADPHTLDLFNPGSDYTVDNALISGGTNQESEEDRALRFSQFVAALSRGTIAALQYAARLPVVTDPVSGASIERVERVSVQEEPGHVFLYVFNGRGATSQALVDAVTHVIEGYRDSETLEWVGGYRPAGMRVDVVAMEEYPVDVEIEVDVSPALRTDALKSEVEGAIGRVVMAALPSSDLRPIELINAAISVAGVDGAIVLSPTSPISVGLSRVLIPGEVTVTWKP